MSDFQVLGGCLCGNVRWKIIEPPRYAFASCHCTVCRRAHAAPFVMWMGAAARGFELTVDGELLSEDHYGAGGARRVAGNSAITEIITSESEDMDMDDKQNLAAPSPVVAVPIGESPNIDSMFQENVNNRSPGSETSSDSVFHTNSLGSNNMLFRNTNHYSFTAGPAIINRIEKSGRCASRNTGAGLLGRYSSSDTCNRFFCLKCGTHTHMRYSSASHQWSEEVSIATATVDEPYIKLLDKYILESGRVRNVHLFYSDRTAALGDLDEWAKAPKFGGSTGVEQQ